MGYKYTQGHLNISFRADISLFFCPFIIMSFRFTLFMCLTAPVMQSAYAYTMFIIFKDTAVSMAYICI